jgi:hypothetical protein
MYTKSHYVHGFDYECTSRLLSKSGSKDEFQIINRLRNLLVDLSKEALKDMNIGHNQRAKRLLEVFYNGK